MRTPVLLSLLTLLVACAATEPERTPPPGTAQMTAVAVFDFDDDVQSENLALQNARFAAAFPAGPRVSAALREAVANRGIRLVDVQQVKRIFRAAGGGEPASPEDLSAFPEALAAMRARTGVDGILFGTVTQAYVMSEALPTNVVAARFRLFDTRSGQVVAVAEPRGGAYNNVAAAADLAKKIVVRIP